MPLIDFKEIAQANTGEGNQDSFELFTRDFLVTLGFEVIEEPARGADEGRDLIVVEKYSEKDFRWLVSCKHFAHNQKGIQGKSVAPSDELDILDRVKSKNCDGFLGFYSSLPSEGLMNKLRGLNSQIGFQIYDYEKIESLLVGYFEREQLFLRYFPNSYKRWKDLNYYREPVEFFKVYFESKFEYYKPLIECVFGAVENLIKLIRNKNSIEEVFGDRNVEIKVTRGFYYMQPIILKLFEPFAFKALEEKYPNAKTLEMPDKQVARRFHKTLTAEEVATIKNRIEEIEDLQKKPKDSKETSPPKNEVIEMLKNSGRRLDNFSFTKFRSFLLSTNELLVTPETNYELTTMFEDLKAHLG